MRTAESLELRRVARLLFRHAEQREWAGWDHGVTREVRLDARRALSQARACEQGVKRECLGWDAVRS